MSALVIGGIACSIPMEDLGDKAIVESWPAEGPQATVWFQCAYANRYALIKALRGTTVASGRNIIRVVPYQYPASPNLYCLAIGDIVGIKPYVDSSGWVQYRLARFAATFARPPFDFNQNSPDGQNDPSGQPWTETKFKVSAEIITPPSGSYYVGPFGGGAGKKVDDSSIGIVAANCEISMTRQFMPFVPLNEIMNAGGLINQFPVTFANRTFAKGNLLFISADTSPSTDPAGNASQTINYTIMGKANDWNQVYDNAGALQYLNTKNDGTGKTPYSYIDFSLLP